MMAAKDAANAEGKGLECPPDDWAYFFDDDTPSVDTTPPAARALAKVSLFPTPCRAALAKVSLFLTPYRAVLAKVNLFLTPCRAVLAKVSLFLTPCRAVLAKSESLPHTMQGCIGKK